ncbi:MAG: cytochrome c oxidase subunit 3 [Chitinophagaceae bacterium]
MLSSVTVHLALRALKARRIPVFRAFVVLSLVLGLCFGLLQYIIIVPCSKPVRLDGNPSESFLFIIWGLHLAHIAGGIVALLVVWLRSFRKNVKEYSATGMSIAANYWHFVDLLWLYLFIFFLVNQYKKRHLDD